MSNKGKVLNGVKERVSRMGCLISNNSIEMDNTATQSILLDGINANSTPKTIENKIILLPGNKIIIFSF